MFSGIVEECATLVAMVKDQENVHFTFKCSFVSELKIDQSVSHNGVCLTVVSLTDDTYTVTAMKETLDRSNLGLHAEILEAMRKQYGETVFSTVISRSIRVAESMSRKTDVVSYSRNSNGAADYRSLTREILSRLNMVDNK